MSSYQELKAQAEELLRKAESMRVQERSGVLAEIKAKMREYGITPAELGSSASRAGRRSVVAPKYRDPATGDTWSGRGQPPKWLQAHLSAGKTREQFLIA